MILVYADKITPRLRYACDVIFRDVLAVQHLLTQDIEKAKNHKGPCVNYSGGTNIGGISIVPHGLLAERGMQEQGIQFGKWEDLPVFFIVKNDSDLPFDIFSMVFYLVSRYEEYLPHEKDQHGRFKASNSIACKNNFLEMPLVNMLCRKFADLIIRQYPSFKIKGPGYKFVPTFDIDIAFAHLAKGFPRNILGMGKLILKGKMKELEFRLRVMSGKEKDPYDNFGYQFQQVGKFNLDPVYFILIGDLGPYDRNNDYRAGRFRQLTRMLANNYSTGIHPSYGSSEDSSLLTEEINRLKEITGKEVNRSRQHFLRLKLPDTYRLLLENGITDDFSMGYSDKVGFRASISSNYYFYDIEKESETNLRIHPFCFMDTAFADNLKVTPAVATQRAGDLLSRVRQSGGVAYGIWHNYALSETHGYEGWRSFFEDVIQFYSSGGK